MTICLRISLLTAYGTSPLLKEKRTKSCCHTNVSCHPAAHDIPFEFPELRMLPLPPFLENRCSRIFNDDVAYMLPSSSGKFSLSFFMSACPLLLLLPPIDGGIIDRDSHISCSSFHLSSGMTDFAGVLVSFFAKSNGPARYTFSSSKQMLSLNLPYFCRSGFDRGDNSTRRP